MVVMMNTGKPALCVSETENALSDFVSDYLFVLTLKSPTSDGLNLPAVLSLCVGAQESKAQYDYVTAQMLNINPSERV